VIEVNIFIVSNWKESNCQSSTRINNFKR